MYNKKDIVKTLNDLNYFIDEEVLNNFIKNWKIDPMYEDDDGIEFFDNTALVKLKKGIKLKSQGYDTEKIIYYINNIPGVDAPKTSSQSNSEDSEEKTDVAVL